MCSPIIRPMKKNTFYEWFKNNGKLEGNIKYQDYQTTEL